MKQEDVPEIIYPENVVDVLDRTKYKVAFGAKRAATYHYLMYARGRALRWSVLITAFLWVAAVVFYQWLDNEWDPFTILTLVACCILLSFALFHGIDLHARLTSAYWRICKKTDIPDMDMRALGKLSRSFNEMEEQYTKKRKVIPFLFAHNLAVVGKKCGYLFHISKWEVMLGLHINLATHSIFASKYLYKERK